MGGHRPSPPQHPGMRPANPPQGGTGVVAPKTIEVVLSGPTAADLEARKLREWIWSLKEEHAREVGVLGAERDLARAERDLFLFLMRKEDGRPAPAPVERAEERVAEARAKLKRLKGEK